jgi:hypothetical protein
LGNVFVILDSCMLHFQLKNYDMDIRGPKLIWCGIMCHIIILFLFLIFSGSWSQRLHFCRDMPWQIYMLWKKKSFLFFSFFDFVDKFFLTPFKYDVHVCVFTMMYMFVYSPWCTCLCIHHDVYVYKLHLYKIH